MGSGRDRALMVALIVIVAALAVVTTPSDETNQADVRPSSFRTTAHGTNALYQVLEELGMKVDRRLTSYVDPDTTAGPLVVLAPTQSPSPAELGVLMAWLREGGAMVYAAHDLDSTLDSLGLALSDLAPEEYSGYERALWEGRSATPALHAWTQGTPPVKGFGRAFADTSAAFRGDVEALLSTSGGDPVVIALRVGKGMVVAWSDPGPLTNRELKGSGAAAAFARTAAAVTAPGEVIRFDEYHHGYREGGSAVGATLRFLRETGPGRMTLQLLAAAGALLLLLGWRFGAPIPPPPARRRSPLEHVEALAGAYRQAGARATARRLLLAGLARRLGRGAHDVRDEGEFLERLKTRLPVGGDAAREVQEEWRKGDGADLAALSRDIDRLLEEVRRP